MKSEVRWKQRIQRSGRTGSLSSQGKRVCGTRLSILVLFVSLRFSCGCVISADTEARIVVTRGDLSYIDQAIAIFLKKQGRLPRSLDELTQETDDAPGLLNKGHLSDSWGHPFVYTVKGTNAFSLCSAGPDGRMGTRDDIAQEKKPASVDK